MALNSCALNLDGDRRELLPRGDASFPCAGYRMSLQKAGDAVIPWHWHQEPEFLFVEQGSLRLKTPDGSLLLKQGQGAFLNSNVLHGAEAEHACTLLSLVFDPRLISGHPQSSIETKYVNPLTACPAVKAVLLDPAEDWAAEAISCFLVAFSALENDAPCHEFTVREQLSAIWKNLYLRFRPILLTPAGKEPPDARRIRQMMHFIHEHYMEPLSLSEIAASAGIGERECLRCFKRTIGISPGQYLVKHRMAKAAVFLKETDRSVTGIAADCGFESPSNFSRTFRKYYDATPLEYRRQAGSL